MAFLIHEVSHALKSGSQQPGQLSMNTASETNPAVKKQEVNFSVLMGCPVYYNILHFVDTLHHISNL